MLEAGTAFKRNCLRGLRAAQAGAEAEDNQESVAANQSEDRVLNLITPTRAKTPELACADAANDIKG